MRSYQTFGFDAVRLDAKACRISLEYSLSSAQRGGAPTVRFTETIDLPKGELQMRRVPKELLDRALKMLHMIGGVSYYKTCLPPEIVVRTGPLSEHQASFFATVYREGLGEFFYRNGIDPHGKILFPSSEAPSPDPWNAPEGGEHVLVPFGGGKDSVVTAEMLSSTGIPVTLLRMNAHPAIDRLAAGMKLPLLTVQRTLAPALLDLNDNGALNGHVPITGYLHALSLVIALLYGFRAVAFSNERSANIGSTTASGIDVNHQWSKSLQFERMFQEECARWITPDVPVFSMLRPWSELMITQRFAELTKYHRLATSCNENWKLLQKSSSASSSHVARTATEQNPVAAPRGRLSGFTWCGRCPKCAFAFAMFAAWLPASQVISMLEANCFADKKLLPTYRQLLGIEGMKPFECVGTAEETRAAFLLAHRRGDLEGSAAMRMFVKEALPGIADGDALLAECLEPVADHAIPPAYSTILPERPPIRLL